MTEPKLQIVGRDCKNVVYARSQIKNDFNDLHLIKEYQTFSDGTRTPKIILKHNHPVDFWITKPAFRNHVQKKESESVDKLTKYTTTRTRLINDICRALNIGAAHSLKTLARSPYLYGCGTPSTSIIRHKYKSKFPVQDGVPYTVAALDIETNLHKSLGPNETSLIAVTFGSKIFLGYNKRYFNIHNYPTKILEKAKLYMSDLVDQRKLEIEVVGYDNAGECVSAALKKLHEWLPDVVSIWNLDYDLPKMEEDLKNYGFNLADEFSDPSVPPVFRFFKYNKDLPQKKTQSGAISSKNPIDLWHTASHPAGWFFCDSMALYKRLRAAKGNLPNYKLETILQKELKLGKQKFPALTKSKENTAAWHLEMSRDFPVEYGLYNIFDCIALELLDEKTRDICQTTPQQVGITDFDNFNSNPTLIADDLHFFYQEEENEIYAVASDKMRDELDDLTVPLKGWIVTLPAYMMADNGIPVIKELPNLKSMFRVHNNDCDIISTYPTLQDALNISKATTCTELVSIEGVEPADQYMIGIHLTGGPANAIELGNVMFGLPGIEMWANLVETM